MAKILTYNVTLEGNLSYAHTFKRVIKASPNNEWYYGAYGYNGPIRDIGWYTLVPCTHDPNFLPKQFEQTCQQIKPDVLFMHEDLQRLIWTPGVKNLPVALWLPWDNEDPGVRQAIDLARNADVVISVAKFAQAYWRTKGINAYQVYNPVDTDVYYPDEKAGAKFREHLNIPDDHKIITWIGRPGWRKRFSHIIEIAHRIIKKNPNVHLLLHTDFNDPSLHFKPEELLYAKDMLKGDSVIWPNDLNFQQGYPPEAMNSLLNATDVYIAPHGGEGMCLPIVEAMSASKPFVATDYTTTQEFADYKERGKNMLGRRGIGSKVGYMFRDRGILRPYVDIDDFVKKTEMLLSNDEMREEMGRLGREFVVKEVDSKVVGQKITAILDDITSVNSIGAK